MLYAFSGFRVIDEYSVVPVIILVVLGLLVLKFLRIYFDKGIVR